LKRFQNSGVAFVAKSFEMAFREIHLIDPMVVLRRLAENEIKQHNETDKIHEAGCSWEIFEVVGE
jgi:hypothetical protein